MVSSSKILTVSYGTFSCTAEGFDDPLEVVKETTHFFRGVVGEDRFFGAEPPQFDPELASEYLRDRLADGGNSTLSLGSPPRVMAAAASAGAMAAAMNSGPADDHDDLLPDDDTIEATAVVTETPVPDSDDLMPEVAPDVLAPERTEAAPAPQSSAPDDIAAKLDRIRAVVAHAAEAQEVDVAQEVDMAPESHDAPDTADVLTSEPEPEPVAVEPDLGAVDTAREDSLESLLNDLAADDEDELPDLTADLDEDDEDLDRDEDDGALDAAVASLLADSHDTEDEDNGAPRTTDTALAAAAGALAAGRAHANEAADAPEPAPESARDEDAEAALDEAWAAQAGPAQATSPEPEIAEETADGSGSTPVRARVVKVKRAAFEQAMEEGTLEEVHEDTADVTRDETSSLSPEEEEELARELAAVKAELASDFGAWDEDEDAATGFKDDDEDETGAPEAAHAAPLRLDNPITTAEDDLDEGVEAAVQDSARKAIKMASPARVMLTEREVEDDDTSRLLDQTNTEMDEPEGNRRRSAIAHLRAAVAATKADRLLGHKADAAEEQEPYREDLASVVRPRRPQGSDNQTARPTTTPGDDPSPLKLVAEQRVPAADAAPAADAGPVRPRRVRRTMPVAADPAGDGDAAGFAAYASDVGAKDLPELLEAAAAYMSYVEGRDQFSRPQLMTTLRQAEVTDSSREDRLRSFGQLLREGKIRKTSGGRFTAAETISFKPAANG